MDNDINKWLSETTREVLKARYANQELENLRRLVKLLLHRLGGKTVITGLDQMSDEYKDDVVEYYDDADGNRVLFLRRGADTSLKQVG